jgi:hypothetical protein
MAQGRSNAAIGRTLVVTKAAVAKHIASILSKLDLPPAEDDKPTRPGRSGVPERPELSG